jgi:cytochrome-b5 reductase
LNLSTCGCLIARAIVLVPGETEEELVSRPYTPISTNALIGCFDVLIKHYGPKARMSRHIHENLKIGDTLEFSHTAKNVKLQASAFIGPISKKKHIVMLVGGTGISPMIQALHAILGGGNDNDKDDEATTTTKVTLLYGCRSQKKILGREMFDHWRDVCGGEEEDRVFNVKYVLSREPRMSEWKGERGYIKASKILRFCPPPSTGDDLLMFVCGPPRMYDTLCGSREETKLTGILATLGYSENQVYKF